MQKWFGVRKPNSMHKLPDLMVFGYDDGITYFIHDHRGNCTRDFSSLASAERFAKCAKIVYEFRDDFIYTFWWWRFP
jgi:hypothetical protein